MDTSRVELGNSPGLTANASLFFASHSLNFLKKGFIGGCIGDYRGYTMAHMVVHKTIAHISLSKACTVYFNQKKWVRSPHSKSGILSPHIITIVLCSQY